MSETTTKKTTKKNVPVDPVDMYRLLIGEVRYGCSRNNHLMPSGAFDTCRKYLPILMKTNADVAIRTAQQLCEEVISELNLRFYDGEDDENGNRKLYVQFIEECIKFVHENGGPEDWVPFNYNDYQGNLATDDIPQFIVLDADTRELLVDAEHALTRKNYLEIIFRTFVEAKEGETYSYNYQRLTDENNHVVGYIYRILGEKERGFIVQRIRKA